MRANFVRGYCEIELFITHSISLNPKAGRKFLPTDLTYCLRKHYEKRLFSHAVTAVPVSDQILQGFCFCTLHLVDFPIRLAPSMRKAFFPFSVFFSDSSLSYIFRFSIIIMLRLIKYKTKHPKSKSFRCFFDTVSNMFILISSKLKMSLEDYFFLSLD